MLVSFKLPLYFLLMSLFGGFAFSSVDPDDIAKAASVSSQIFRFSFLAMRGFYCAA